MKRVNVSQVEYTTKMGVYTKMTQETSRPRRLSSLSPTKVEGEGSGNEVLRFSLTELSLTEGALLKMFVMGASSVSVYQVVSDGSEALVREIAEMSPGGLWVDSHLNLPSASISESSEIAIRVDCGSNCKVLEPSVNLLISTSGGRPTRQTYLTDCANQRDKLNLQCCRQEMMVIFKKIGMEDVLAPYNVDAGFCEGLCSPRLNLRYEHTYIQVLMNRYFPLKTPPPCCAPSKLESLQVTKLNADDPTKMDVLNWNNMIVTECQCV